MPLTRRRFMSAVGASTAGLAMSPLLSFYSRVAQGKPRRGFGFGALEPRLPLNADELTNTVVGDLSREPILALPPGFNYRVLSMTGQMMSDGSLVPAGHDGMAAFDGPGNTTLLVRNHELGTSLPATYSFGVSGAPRYSKAALGGTSTLVVGPNRKLERHFVSLAGTSTNCAGGKTPWGSWLTCEETFSTTTSDGQTIRHGYTYEVIADAWSGIVAPVPLKAMGRFSHEATGTDPRTGFIYETEDRSDSCFYRFVPTVPGHPAGGGRLFALKIIDGPQNTTNNATQGGMPGAIPVGSTFPVEWVEIDIVDPDAESRPGPAIPANRVAVRYQAQAKGAAIYYRGEGVSYGNDAIYFISTQAGPPAPENLPSPPGSGRGNGQVWAYDPQAEELTLVVEAASSGELLDEPDNVTVTPFGDLFLCEDSSDDFQYIVGVNPDGELYPFAKNVLFSQGPVDPALASFVGNEFAGACFAPDGKTFFVNIQTPGITFAIWGPWARGGS
jgi:secreted PhoX family phosphatase